MRFSALPRVGTACPSLVSRSLASVPMDPLYTQAGLPWHDSGYHSHGTHMAVLGTHTLTHLPHHASVLPTHENPTWLKIGSDLSYHGSEWLPPGRLRWVSFTSNFSGPHPALSSEVHLCRSDSHLPSGLPRARAEAVPNYCRPLADVWLRVRSL